MQAYPHLGDTGFQLALIGSAGLAGMLNYLVFLSATVNSPLTTSITGQAKNVIGSLGGYLLMPSSAGGGPVSERLLNVAGCCIGLCASMWYGVFACLAALSINLWHSSGPRVNLRLTRLGFCLHVCVRVCASVHMHAHEPCTHAALCLRTCSHVHIWE